MNSPKAKKIKLSLYSDISINPIDAAHVDLHPAFVRPDGVFLIQAIGETKIIGGNQDNFSVYAENNGKNYLIEIESVEDQINRVTLYQNILTLTPKDPDEWEEILNAIVDIELELDDIVYKRTLGGSADKTELCELDEHVKTKSNEFNCKNKVMQYERKIPVTNFTEKLKAVVEVIESREQATVTFCIGFDVHPSMITILGN